MITARFQLTAPLSHSAFGADAGNAVPLRRMPIVSLPGAPAVPVVSGNAIRNGGLRRELMRELFAALGLGHETPEWDRIYAALANGGTITAAEKRLDPERIRAVREAVPALSVLGSALYTWLLPGHCSVGIAWPVCRETVEAGLVSGPEGGAPLAAELEAEYTESRLPDREQQDPEQTGVGEMPVTVEVLLPGTVLESEIRFARHAPVIERAAIAHGLTLLDALGGKSAHGLGAFRLAVAGDDTDPEPYRAWLADEAALGAARDAVMGLPETW